MNQVSNDDMADLRHAHKLLENPGFAARLMNVLGNPLDKLLTLLPKRVNRIIQTATKLAIQIALETAVLSMGSKKSPSSKSSDRVHKTISVITGGFSGYFGGAALVAELPITTTIILRSIADIARSEGEDLRTLETHLECVQVFALGGKSQSDDATETGYYAVRGYLARTLSDAAEFIAERGFIKDGAPAIVKLVSRIAARYSIIVADKVALQAIPIIGATTGATINFFFMKHFQGMARGHFIVRRLERNYDNDTIKALYESL